MSPLVDGADRVAVGVSLLHLRVMEARPNHRLCRRNPLPLSGALAPIHYVTGQVGLAVRLPA